MGDVGVGWRSELWRSMKKGLLQRKVGYDGSVAVVSFSSRRRFSTIPLASCGVEDSTQPHGRVTTSREAEAEMLSAKHESRSFVCFAYLHLQE
jgi:hypothetical protein